MLNRTQHNFEVLENRRLLAAQIVDHVLEITGTDSRDNILLSSSNGLTTVTLNDDPQMFAEDSYDSIEIQCGDGDDAVAIEDNLVKPALIFGDEGWDSLKGGGGDDTLVGGAGNDSMAGGGLYEAPGGINTVDYSDRSDSITVEEGNVTFESGEADLLGRNIQRFISGSDDDALNFFSSAAGDTHYVDAGPGNDQINLAVVEFSDATVHGGEGNDGMLIIAPNHIANYYGDDGNDYFRVQRSSSTTRDFKGGDGVDTVNWAGFNNEFWPVTVTLDDVADDGSPTEWPGQIDKDNVHSDVERIIATAGDDTIVGSDADNTIYGNGGNDTIHGGDGRDRLYGDDGDDWLSGDEGNDVIYGEAGDDRIFGGSGRDYLHGGDGADTIRGEGGQDRIVGDFLDDLRGNRSDTVIEEGVV